MKELSILVMLLILQCRPLHAQLPKERMPTNHAGSNPPYVLVDTFQTELSYLIIDARKIESVNVIKDTSATKKYGEKGRYGVVLIRTEPNTILLRLPALLDAFSFPDSLRNLRVNINEVIIQRPELLLIDPTQVESIQTKMMPKWHDLRNNEEELFIHITQKKKA